MTKCRVWLVVMRLFAVCSVYSPMLFPLWHYLYLTHSFCSQLPPSHGKDCNTVLFAFCYILNAYLCDWHRADMCTINGIIWIVGHSRTWVIGGLKVTACAPRSQVQPTIFDNLVRTDKLIVKSIKGFYSCDHIGERDKDPRTSTQSPFWLSEIKA